MNIALFVGSFDPFTIGHQAIVSRALPLFDRLVIGVGVNERKQTMFSSEERVDTLRQLYANEPRVSVVAYTDLTVDLARREGATFIVKGVRSMKDFEYEREQADINRRLTGIDTLLFFADPELASISSSMVRELMHFGRDVTPFLPVARP
ncbi:MAG: pantetheine-phosphate adenylyltransferase [Prevotella sp.]|nr:pantetheine-phosphate adenylyltransferase [Prevotella sp.]MCI5853948.1 pantetheine-phosphate adenylyltransferase [Prevotella sp.]MDD6738234.1 pantetheine-phosphate adenylyltransferase [Prevotella sp.]MDY6092490.1 pantetheine-phosphate adenylyltransferase [Prevotella sp.]